MIRLSDEVRDALAAGRAVVALETTLVAHGFPPGEGVEVGLASERAVREAAPCRPRSASSTARSCGRARRTSSGASTPRARKIGPRDLAAAAVQGAVGATTVGGTLAVCRRPGIRFMATGGLGGVHRGWPRRRTSRPTSPSSRATPALVVSSGVKSLLDVPATAELLETLGVPVLGWRTDTLPLFYAARGGPPVSARVETADEAARIATRTGSSAAAALLLGRPPDESLDDVEPLIEQALAAADAAGVRGQAVTPFVLAWLHRESGGRTLAANRDLVVGNARLAGEVAAARHDDPRSAARDEADGCSRSGARGLAAECDRLRRARRARSSGSTLGCSWPRRAAGSPAR